MVGPGLVPLPGPTKVGANGGARFKKVPHVYPVTPVSQLTLVHDELHPLQETDPVRTVPRVGLLTLPVAVQDVFRTFTPVPLH